MDRERTGWLLDLYEDPLGGVTVWFLDDSGQRLRLRQRLPVTFYAAGAPARLKQLRVFIEEQSVAAGHPVAARCGMEKRMDVFARREVEVLAVEVSRPSDLGGLLRRAARRFADLDYADADVQLSLRYAAATGVSPLCRCRVQTDPAGMIQAIAPLEDPWGLDPSALPLRVMTLEPDCDPAHRAPRWVLVGVGGRAHRLSLTFPRALLVALQSLLKAHDPDLLLTSWGDTWLLPRLMDMAEEYGVELALNRDRDAGIARRKERWYFSYGQIIYRGDQVLLAGRWHIDRKNAMMWSDYELEGTLETARVTALPVQTAARVSPGTGISAIQILAALRRKILVPWQKQQAEMPKPAADLFTADQGGLVFQPVVGVHFGVAALDFVSMYPAIIVRAKISPECLLGPENHKQLALAAEAQAGVGAALASAAPAPAARAPAARAPVQKVPEVNLWIDGQRDGIVSLALAPLLEKRVSLKRRQGALPAWDPRRASDRRRSSALKWLLVTCFGYLGYKNARFGRIEAHQAVTAYGREALLRAKETVEGHGGRVLHAYVDSVFVKWDGPVQAGQLAPLLAEIEERTGLPIALDGVYRWVVFLPSRVDPDRPVANRYFGVFESGEIKVRGISARRRDTPPYIAQTQMELVELLAAARDPLEALPAAGRLLGARLAALRAHRIQAEDLLAAQRLTRDADAYRSPSPAARAAQQLQAAGKTVKPGQRVRFVFTLGRPGVYAWDLPQPPDPAHIDVARYSELLRRAAGEVLDPFLVLRPPGEVALPGPGWNVLPRQRSLLPEPAPAALRLSLPARWPAGAFSSGGESPPG